jgi:NAD(P)-dependent dehydrogenase (short-subunit alcohol dehydrogenase family)
MEDARVLDGRVAIITGGSQGIGEAVTRRFVSEGASVVIVARNEDKALLRRLDTDRASFVVGDVSDVATAERVFATAAGEFGRVDILVNNAAIDYSGVQLVDTPTSDIMRVFDVNTLGAIYMLQEAARRMQDGVGGAVVNVISRAGLVGIAGMSIYGASKGALASLTRAAAVELAPYGIRVNAVAPSATDTPMMRTWIEQQVDPGAFERELVRGLLEERLARPEEVADAILFLASSASAYVTGICLPVDGG